MKTRNYNRLVVAIAVLCAPMTVGCNQKPPVAASPHATTSASPSPTQAVRTSADDVAKNDLAQLGAKTTTAVLAKDTKTLLSYELEEPRREDEIALQSTNDQLYCYLFNSACYANSRVRSVYDILSSAKDLAIKASVTRSAANGRLYGLLVFYDKSNVSDQQLLSEKFLCSDDALKKVASWHFEFGDEKWRARSLFDYGTEGLCSEQD